MEAFEDGALFTVCEQAVVGSTRITTAIVDGELMQFEAPVSLYSAGQAIRSQEAPEADRLPLDVRYISEEELGGTTYLTCSVDGEAATFNLDIIQKIANGDFSQPNEEETE